VKCKLERLGYCGGDVCCRDVLGRETWHTSLAAEAIWSAKCQPARSSKILFGKLGIYRGP